MIKQSLLTKKVKSTRTYKYKIVGNTSYLDKQFKKIQTCRRLYFNYALQYLYQHYGVKHFNTYLPDNVRSKQFLIRKLITFARVKASQHQIDLRKMDYSVQSIDKMLMELITNFAKYRHLQYQTKYWSMTKRAKYLKKHNCNLTGFGRINYKHDDADLISATFKQQVHHNSKGQLSYNAIRLQNNYAIIIPFLKKLQTKESLAKLKNKSIAEVTVKQRTNGDYELQVKFRFIKQKHLSKEDTKNITGLDVNSANNQLYVFSDGRIDGLPDKLIKKLKYLDKKVKQYNHYLDTHKHNKSKTYYKKQQTHSKLEAKISNLITAYQWILAKEYAKLYHILMMEDLHSFNMRLSTHIKDKYKHKNINRKLALVKPGTFKKQMITAFENTGSLLFTVNPFDTSKCCSICGYIYQDLPIGQKVWTCPHCHVTHDRDHNSTIDIIDFTLHPEKHPILQEPRFHYLTVDDLVNAY